MYRHFIPVNNNNNIETSLLWKPLSTLRGQGLFILQKNLQRLQADSADAIISKFFLNIIVFFKILTCTEFFGYLCLNAALATFNFMCMLWENIL